MEIENDTTFETKAGIPADAAVTHAELMRAFDEFKEANDQRLSEKRSVDVLLEEKIERLDSVIAAQTQRLEAIELKQARPAIGSETHHRPAAASPLRRSGRSPASRIDQQQRLQKAHDGDRPGRPGGSARPTRARRPARPALDELSFPAMELYAMPAATTDPPRRQRRSTSASGWRSEVDRVFAAQEGAAFVTGDGNNKPKGFLSRTPTVANSFVDLGQHRIRVVRRCRGLPVDGAIRRAGPAHLCAQSRLPPECVLRDEPQDAERDPQVQGCARPVSLGPRPQVSARRRP